MGIIFIILKDSRHKSISFGLSQAAFILAITFLIPNRFLTQLMHNINLLFQDKFKLNAEKSGILSLIPGFFLAFLFIALEAFCLKYLSPYLKRLLDNTIMKL